MTEGIPQWTVLPQPGYQINSTSISADGRVCLLGTSQEYGSGEFAVACYDGTGNLKWSDALGSDAYQGVFWVDLSADGAYAAAGGTISDSADAAGFLRAYRVADGELQLDLRFPSRVNQVALSERGDVLAAVAGDSLMVYAHRQGRYQSVGIETLAGQYLESCAISADGARIVVGTTGSSESTQGSTGLVVLYALGGQGLERLATTVVDVGILRVAMLPDGGWWVASRHDGQAMAFDGAHAIPAGAPAWTYAPAGLQVDTAYGIAVARNPDGAVDVVCGANLVGEPHGCLYAVRSMRDAPAGPPAPLWQRMLRHDPNPGINMDRGGRLVTATDGEPESGGAESRGTFYLFEVASGDQVWRYPTPLMNWPMAISAQGNAAFGGSDDGSAYYWTLG